MFPIDIAHIIGDHTPAHHATLTAGMRGAIPRDFDVQPLMMKSVDFPLIPDGEVSSRIADMTKAESSLYGIRKREMNKKGFKSLDQGQKGYCWAHSTAHGVIYLHAKAGLPYIPLSAYAVACKIKNFRDEGGWGALSAEFVANNGIPAQQFWAQGSMDRSNDNAATWADAAKHKLTAQWADLANDVWDRNLAIPQWKTLLLTRIPVVMDFNWWGHSVLGIELVDGMTMRDVMRGGAGKLLTADEFDLVWGVNTIMMGIGVRIQNSWGDVWNGDGTGVLTGSKAICDGAIAPLVAA